MRITPGELVKGIYVTYLEEMPYEEEVVSMTGDVRTVTRQNKHPMGKGLPFKVLSVDLPLVLTENTSKHPNFGPVVIFDTRHVRLHELEKEYVNILIKKTKSVMGAINPTEVAQ